MKHAIDWFDIPVQNMERAMAFYSAVYDAPVMQIDMGGQLYAMLPGDPMNPDFVGGGLMEGTPSKDGVRVYLNGGDDLQHALDRAVKAGATVILPKTLITEENGYMAIFEDTEGNAIGLHSRT
ncbi:MAG: VOC family protein [Anaerolineae bacterium]